MLGSSINKTHEWASFLLNKTNLAADELCFNYLLTKVKSKHVLQHCLESLSGSDGWRKKNSIMYDPGCKNWEMRESFQGVTNKIALMGNLHIIWKRVQKWKLMWQFAIQMTGSSFLWHN